MSMIQVVKAIDESNAAIIRGFLENNGIHATYSPDINYRGRVNISATVYVSEEKYEEALKILKEQGLISSLENNNK
ncbi:MAG: DUF2007 domain-containing protein [bacterium]|nr:DUF2007 domain-containing protein [bacterium]